MLQTMVFGGNPSASPQALAVARSLLADATTYEVTTAFRRANIRSILLKGPTIATWLYEHVSMRPYVDSDLMIAVGDLDRAEEVLAALGFEQEPISASTRFDDIPHGLPWHAHNWVRWRDGAGLDLHRTLIGAAAEPEEVWRVLSAQTVGMQIGDLEVEALPEPARAVHVALHAAQDGGLRKPLQDLERAIDRLPIEGWEQAARLAERLDAAPAFAAGLRLLRAGERLASQLGLPAEAPLSVRLRASGAPHSALSLEWLTRIHGIRSKALYAFQKAFPPKAYMRAWSPLTERGLAAAYVHRVLWLISATGSAVRWCWRGRRGTVGVRSSARPAGRGRAPMHRRFSGR